MEIYILFQRFLQMFVFALSRYNPPETVQEKETKITFFFAPMQHQERSLFSFFL